MMPPPGLQICLRPRVTLTFDILHPSSVTQLPITVICACQVWLKLVGYFLIYLAKRESCDLFRICRPLTLYDPKVDHFMPLPRGPFVRIGITSTATGSHRSVAVDVDDTVGSFVFKILCSQVGNRRTNGRTDERTNERTDRLIT